MHLLIRSISTTSCDDLARATEAQDGKKIAGGGLIFRWSASKPQVATHRKVKRADQKEREFVFST